MSKLIMPSKTERLMQKNPFLLTRGHDYVEIGGVKWATCNVGAEKPTDPGFYFQWGDIQGYTAEQVGIGEYQKYFDWNDYKLYESSLLKYNDIDGRTVLDISDDAVHAAWGGAWRMPTREEFDILEKAVNTTWTDNYQGTGVAGVVCTDKTDSSKVLFFPAVGCCEYGKAGDVGYLGFYWSNISNDTPFGSAYGTCFSLYNSLFGVFLPRSVGAPVRGVC